MGVWRWALKHTSLETEAHSLHTCMVNKTEQLQRCELQTFCRCERCISSPKGDDSGSSNASNARVCSSWLLMSAQSSLFSARCVWAKSRAAATSLLRISSIRCCCYDTDITETVVQIQQHQLLTMYAATPALWIHVILTSSYLYYVTYNFWTLK